MHETPKLTAPLTAFFACAVGVIIINLSAAQPLTGPIAESLRMPAALAGLVATLPQLGYAVGMIFVDGAVGAALAGVAWAAYGWTGVCIVCLGFTVLTFVGDFLQVPSREFRPTAA